MAFFEQKAAKSALNKPNRGVSQYSRSSTSKVKDELGASRNAGQYCASSEEKRSSARKLHQILHDDLDRVMRVDIRGVLKITNFKKSVDQMNVNESTRDGEKERKDSEV